MESKFHVEKSVQRQSVIRQPHSNHTIRMKSSNVIKISTSIKILPVQGPVKDTTIQTALTNCKFVALMAVYMAALGTYVAAGFVFNPTSSTEFSVKLLAGHAFRYIGLGGGFPMPVILAFSAVRLGDEALGGDYQVTWKKLTVIVVISSLFIAGLVIIHIPLFIANYNYFLLSVIPLVFLVSLNMIKYFMIFTVMHIWIADLKNECKAALSGDLLIICDVQKIIERYRRLQLGLSIPSLLLFSATQICVILSVFIITTGMTFLKTLLYLFIIINPEENLRHWFGMNTKYLISSFLRISFLDLGSLHNVRYIL